MNKGYNYLVDELYSNKEKIYEILKIPEEEIELDFVVNKEWLIENLENEEVKIIDCRYDLANSDLGKELYQESHLPGAFHFDLKEQLSAPVSKHGGRHPLPDLNQFKKDIEKVGIDKSKTVIAYDDGSAMYASRFWWLLKYVGHEKVYVLNEGFAGWMEAEYPITKEIPKSIPVKYEVNIQKDMLASVKEVKDIVENDKDQTVLIDSRANERYLGEVEPIDKVAGHIPGAINKVWGEGLRDGAFKSEEEQKDRFSELDKDDSVVVYCGSGVSATPNYIALKMAGFTDVKLYAGSYSDWVSYDDNEVETGNSIKDDKD
ncbi:sulfurtransferase [Carnobacteriaceae bacterium 52-44]